MVWKQKVTSHYIFNYMESTVSERDIEKIAECQESCYEYICDVLQVEMDKKIEYFLCSSSLMVGELYGDDEPCNGFVKEPAQIFAVYNDEVKCIGYHEDTHIISYNTIAKPKQNFIREGLAMYFDRVWQGISNHAWVQVFINSGTCPGIAGLMEREEFFNYRETITYPTAGAFTEYLISAYGIEKYKLFYKNAGEDVNKCFMSVYGISLEEAEKKFNRWIKNIRITEDVLEIIRNRLMAKA